MRRNTKFEKIYLDLLGKIQKGVLKEGESLPPEIPLAKQYGVAVLTLRRALGRLREEGWIVSRPYHGTRVSHPAHARPAHDREDSKTIGIFASAGINAQTHPAFSRIINGMEGALTAAGYLLDIAYCDPTMADYDERLQKKLLASTTQGWLIPMRLSPPVCQILKKQAVPIVLMHATDETLTGHLFDIDYASLAQEILAHLHDRRNIWLVTPASMNNWAEAIEACAAQGGRKGEVRTLAAEGYSVAAGEKAVNHLFAKRVKVDALVCSDDEIAAGAMQALKVRNLGMPEIAVIGGGDFPISSLLSPALSSVAYPYYSIGRDAGRLLIDLVEGHDIPPAHRVFRPKLIVRESSGCPGQSAEHPPSINID